MFGILGANKRYLKYIKPLNPKKEIKLADSKLKTKRLLENIDIPHPKLLDIIKNRKQLKKYNFNKFLGQDFVIKPNKGSKGKGIMICQLVETGKDTTEHKIMIKTGGELLTQDEFKKYLTDILDGKYSLTLGNDIILIEEKVQPGDEFKKFCEYGLADVRIINMNLVPIIAMLRYPTKESNGKANIAAGGIGFGIDIGNGKIVSMYRNKKIYIKEFPSEYSEFYNKIVPYWDDILLYSSQVQYFTNIGYLGLDWVIAKNGPSLLEINARAGMEIQLVNGEGLEKRLRKIEDLKIFTPSKGVEVGKTLFSQKETNPTIKKDVIYLEQPGILKKSKENEKEPDTKNNLEIPINIKVDLEHKFNYADKQLIDNFDKTYTIKFNDIILDDIKFKPKDGLKNTITLGTKLLDDFIIIPQKKDIRNFNIWNKSHYLEIEENSIIEIDNLVDQVSKKLNISKIVKPRNYMEELDNFITWNGNYNPKFEYKYPTDKKLQQIEDDIKHIKEKFFNVKSEYKSGLFKLFEEKITELEYKLKLTNAYKKQNFGEIGKYNRLLFGDIDNNLLLKAKNKSTPFSQYQLGRQLFIFEVVEKVKQHLKKRNIEAKVVLENDLSSRILARRGEPLIIAIGKTATFYEKEIDMVLAHEIDVHVTRYINGKKSGWKILQSGTGFYVIDEEGLAIWNSFNYLPDNYEKDAMYEKYFLLSFVETTDFVNLANIIKGLHPNDSLLRIFKRTLRFKRGIHNTAFKGYGTGYFKDKIYLDGYVKIKNWIENGGSFKAMLNGKYKIEDLKFVS